jgi:hypothetical protein
VYCLKISNLTANSSIIVGDFNSSRVHTSILGTLFIGGVLEAYMMNTPQWKGKKTFFCGWGCLLTTLWTYFRLPQSKEHAYEGLDILLDGRVPRIFNKIAIGEPGDTIE